MTKVFYLSEQQFPHLQSGMNHYSAWFDNTYCDDYMNVECLGQELHGAAA